MRRLGLALILAAAIAARADNLTLRDGTSFSGSWAGFIDGQISFMVDGVVKTFPKSDVAKVTFGPATVKLGQTEEQVRALLGAPKSTQETAGKKIYVYPSLKITFTDGKVTGVE